MKALLAVLLVGLLVVPAAQAADSSLRYQIFLDNGKLAGEQVVTRSAAGVVHVHYIFKDDGRGPEYDEYYRLASDGSLGEYRVQGTLMFGSRVDERFQRSGTHAEWRSTADRGEREVNGLAMYMPLKGSLAPTSIAIGLLAARKPGEELPLLPFGSLRQQVLDKVQISAGGKKRMVQLLAQTGLGLSPKFYWAMVEAKPRLFAAIVRGSNPEMSLIEEGWKDSITQLADRQAAAESRLLAEMAEKLQHKLPGLTVIRNARVFDSEKAVLGAASDVYVIRGRIATVVPAGTPSPEVDQEIDAGGRVLLPGLFDMHAHVKRWDSALDLAAGVTTVRDMANVNTQLQQLMDETNAGKLLAANVVPAGFVDGVSPYTGNYGFVIKTDDEWQRAIDWYAQHGYRQLKIYGSFPAQKVPDAVAYAHSRGMRVAGHVPYGLKAEDVVAAGYDELTHMNMVILNFLIGPDTDTRTLARITLPAEKAAELDLQSAPVQDFIRTLVDKQIVVDPTLCVMAFMKQRAGEVTEVYAPIAEYMPPDVRRNYAIGIMKVPDEKAARYQASYQKMIDLTGMLYKAGVPLVTGTDTVVFGVHAELELYVRAGLTPAQALQVATLNGARYSQTLHERGTITPGKLADLVLIDGDPTTNISDIRKVALVMTRGRLIYPAEIERTLGIEPFVPTPPAVHYLHE
ncbi:amidohydrolase family protein [Duganella sp. FT80W]|uniref:Amidohydrolase family protein n=1 Tax=Duganella guangzhouensis TaxID=2666084 RepID=A0A6I2L7W1_9BURK|nr:amidohydrolase family protein [Duganella guangzhouensis]MRW93850.1 amidohydrolase family protein [Duganella guangzhouensis]